MTSHEQLADDLGKLEHALSFALTRYSQSEDALPLRGIRADLVTTRDRAQRSIVVAKLVVQVDIASAPELIPQEPST